MISFILACAVLLAVAAIFIVFPFFKARTALPRGAALGVPLLVVVLTGLVSAALYLANTKWSWNGADIYAQTRAQPAVSDPEAEAMVAKLADHLKQNPDDINGWLLLGRSQVALQNFNAGIDAYQKAYDLSQGANADAVLGLAEALVLSDDNAFLGRGGQLLEAALKATPNHPKALWYGGMLALKQDKLPLARDRFRALLALEPPEQIRGLLERQVQDLTEQIGDAPKVAVASASQRKITVAVNIDPKIAAQLKEPMTLFVLARTGKGGPPLAVERHPSSAAPLTVELTTDDAMLPTLTLDNGDAVQVVARLSKSGTPTEQSGDYAGQADYSFTQQGAQGSVQITINRQVP